ncbi:hypothetical protein [Campylobacter concisus]|uniref:hypothetical protein n=1 Tax=Campylobacter concisus TaxID=199 RepID=UPI00131C786B|nr:hypothetical protein [Campylobacter concisus]
MIKRVLLLSSNLERNIIIKRIALLLGFRMIQLKKVNKVIGIFESSNRHEKLNLELVKFIRNSQNISLITLLQSKNTTSVFKEIYYARKF